MGYKKKCDTCGKTHRGHLKSIASKKARRCRHNSYLVYKDNEEIDAQYTAMQELNEALKQKRENSAPLGWDDIL